MELDSLAETEERSEIYLKIGRLSPEHREMYLELLQGNREDTYWCEVNHIDLSSEEGFTRSKKITYNEFTNPLERKY